MPAFGENTDTSIEANEELPESLFDMSIEELMDVTIETISRFDENRDDAPGTVYVITKDIIKRRGYRSLKDALQVIPGLNVFHRDLQYVAAFRGLTSNDNEKFTILINGFEINGVNEFELLNGPINLDNVERIEVVVGPSSIFLPSNTLVATINVITRDIDGIEAVFSTGSDIEYGLSLMGGKTWSPTKKWTLSGTLESRIGFDAWDLNKSTGPMNVLDGSRMTGKTDHSHFVIFTGQYQDFTAQVLSYKAVFPELRLPGSIPTNLDTRYTDEVHGIFLKHEPKLTEDLSLLFKFQAAYKKAVRATSTYPWQSVAQYDYNAELGLRYSGIKNHSIQTGIQYIYEDNFDSFFDEDGLSRASFYDTDTWGLGAYLDDTVVLNEKVKLVGGIRADRNTLVPGKWFIGGRAGVTYHANDSWTSKLIYNKTNRMPSPLASLNQLWGLGKPSPWSGHSFLSNPADKPEELSMIEWINIFYAEKTRYSVTLYYQKLKDYISWGDPHTNIGDFKGWGAEFDVQYALREDIDLWANASYIDSKFEAGGFHGQFGHAQVNDDDRLIGSPRFSANAGVDVDLTDKIQFSTQFRYFTEQAFEDPVSGEFDTIDNRYYVDMSLLFKDVLGKGNDLRIAGQNILNNRQGVVPAWKSGIYYPRGAAVTVTAYFKF